MGYREIFKINKNTEKNLDSNIDVKKFLLIAFILNLVQLVLLLILIIYGAKSENIKYYYLVYISVVLILFNLVITLLSYYFIIHKKTNKILIETLSNIEELNRKLREQRHDYLNHMQIIYGLIEIDEFEEAKKYIEPVYKDIIKVSKTLRTAHPAINALLQAKIQMAEKNNIEMYIDVKSNLGKLTIEPWELCKVLSNIIDNGILALNNIDKNRRLNIEVFEDKFKYFIDISNNGPIITNEEMDKIFNEGYTSKRESGHGIGLYIVKRIIDEVKGSIVVSSTKSRTCFSIILPKMKSSDFQKNL